MTGELTSVEQAMLEQAYRFGMGLPELGAFVGQFERGDASPLDVLDGLVAKGYLGQAHLQGQERYYFLAPRMAKEFQVDPNDMGPLQHDEKTRRYAMLRFCLRAHPAHRPLTGADFKEHFPRLFRARPRLIRLGKGRPRFRAYYYGRGRLGYLRVDMGSRYDRVLGKAFRDVARHKAIRPYARLIKQQAFEVTVATATTAKGRRLQNALAKRPTDVPITVRVLPELWGLVAPPVRTQDLHEEVPTH